MPGKNAVKPKEGAELSDPNSVKEGIGDLKAEADRQEDEAQRYAVAFLQKVMRLKAWQSSATISSAQSFVSGALRTSG